MPRGVIKDDAQHFHEILEKAVVLVAGETGGVIDPNGDPVYVSIVVNVQGLPRHPGAIYALQGYGHPDSATEEAFQLLEQWEMESYPENFEELEKEYGDRATEILAETFDAWTWSLPARDFVNAIRGTDAEKYIDIAEPEEEEEEELSEAGPSKARRREQTYGSFIVMLWTGQTGRFHDMPRAQAWALERLNGQQPGAYAAFYRAPVARGRHDTGVPWTEPFEALVVNPHGRIVTAGRENWPNIPPRQEPFPYRGIAQEAPQPAHAHIQWQPSTGGHGLFGTSPTGRTYLLRPGGQGRWNLHIEGHHYGPFEDLDMAKREAERHQLHRGYLHEGGDPLAVEIAAWNNGDAYRTGALRTLVDAGLVEHTRRGWRPTAEGRKRGLSTAHVDEGAHRVHEAFAGDEPTAKNILEWFGPYMEHEGLDAPRESARLARLIEASTGRHHHPENVMLEVNRVIGGYGVEAIRVEGAWIDNYYGDIVATYVNTGDTYSATLLHESATGRFLLTTWGDWFEANEREYLPEEEEKEEEELEEAPARIPEKNIFWRDIPQGSHVELVGHTYVVTLPDRSRAVAYWSGHDAIAAQHTLEGMTRRRPPRRQTARRR